MPHRLESFDKTTRGNRMAVTILLVAGLGVAGATFGQGFIEFTLPSANSNPFGIATGPDGALWFTEGIANRIGRITTTGVVTEFTIPTADSRPSGITVGPDGNLWFTEGGASKIGRITPAGAISEFAIPTTGSFPAAITAGPDGNLWFAYQSLPPNPDEASLVGRIGRITPAGIITEFPTPTTDSSPSGIAAGPDGNLWFTEAGAGKVGRITPAGIITEFSTPTASSPFGIAAGPDGNLWFTERILINGDLSVGKIGRITPGGVMTEFAFPTAGSDPLAGIAAGPDGNLWFTENFVNKIGRITTAGVITEATLHTPDSGTVDITAGPDGNIWFTEHFANKIGRLSPTSCALSATSLCLNNFRFAAEANWTASDGTGGSAQAVHLTQDGGYLWFFSQDNPEIVVKALDGCSSNGHFWLFASGLTDVNVALRVTDTRTGQVRTYANPQGMSFRPILDTSAFVCP